MLKTPEVQDFETKSFYSKDETINISLRFMLQLTYIEGYPFTLNERRFVKAKSTYTAYDEENFTAVALVPYLFSQYSRLSYKNKETGKGASITVWFEAQV